MVKKQLRHLRLAGRLRLPCARCVPSPVYGGGLGRGHAQRFARFTPFPTLPRKRGRAQTEFAARTSGEHTSPRVIELMKDRGEGVGLLGDAAAVGRGVGRAGAVAVVAR